jgi:hypothetical protein
MSAFDDYVAANPGAGDSWAYLQMLLDDYGLGGLGDFVQGEIIAGRSITEIDQRVRTQPEWKTRFGVIDELKEKGLPAMSPAEVVAWEKEVTNQLQSAGVPSGFYDSPDDFKDMILKGISPAEVSTRLYEGFVAAQTGSVETRRELERLYGVTEGEMAAFFLDPDKTLGLIQQRFTAAQRAGTAIMTGYGKLEAAEAERLAALGVSESAAQEGFGKLVQGKELFGGLPGENANDIGRQTQLDATFAGDANAAAEIEKRAKTRAGVFQQGGGFASGKEGYGGLGTAR